MPARIGASVLAVLACGCAAREQERPEREGRLAPPPPGSVSPTFAGDVAALIYRSCTPCHHDGGAGPFPLGSYAEVAKRGPRLLEVVESGFMPPWKPVDGYGEFRGKRGVSPAERLLLRSWVEAGMPEGDARRCPPPPEYPDGWLLGAPDVVLEMDAGFAVDPESFDQWRCFVLPTDFGADRFLRSVEIRPSSPRVVHHVIAYTDVSGSARLLREGDGQPGLAGMCATRSRIDDMLAGWVPGLLPLAFPEGLGLRLRAGADLLVDTHFQATGRTETERMRVGLTFAEGEPHSALLLVRLGAMGMMIPPGSSGYRVEDRFELPVEAAVIAIVPHAHYVCTQVRVWAELPEGGEEPLIWIDDWDFNWQDYYQYAQPVRLPRGAVIRCAFDYDNSAANARNPHAPPRRVVGGSRSIDEMASLFLQVVLPSEADKEVFARAVEAHGREVGARSGQLEGWWSYLVQSYDRDGDLSLDAEEDAAATVFVDGLWEQRSQFARFLDMDGDGRLSSQEEERLRAAIRAWHGEQGP